MVTRKDLSHFDKEATELILWAQEKGATVRISSKGHALIYGPEGGSAAVAPKSKSKNRSGKNNAAGVKRLFRK